MTRKVLEIEKIPYFGYNNYSDRWRELFIHPKDAFGVLLQIAEFRPDDWLAPSYQMPEGKKWTASRNNKEYNLTFAHPGGGKITFSLGKDEMEGLVQDLKNLIQ